MEWGHGQAVVILAKRVVEHLPRKADDYRDEVNAVLAEMYGKADGERSVA